MNGVKSRMRTERVDEMLLVKYLLGTLSEEEKVQVEDRAFADPNYLGALDAAEADLIDAYVRGELPQSDRRLFEGLFLTSPQRRRKVEFARALSSAIAAEAPTLRAAAPEVPSVWQSLARLVVARTFAVQFAAGMATLVLVAGASWLAVENRKMHSNLAALEAQRSDLTAREQALSRQLSQEQGRVAELQKQQSAGGNGPSVFASLILLPGLSRAQSSHAQLVLNRSAQLAHIEIQLEARDNFPRYRTELRTRGGVDILTQANLSRQRSGAEYVVSMDVPASALPVGEYELALKGVTAGNAREIGYYYFGVTRQ
jgi:hypothetical protein